MILRAILSCFGWTALTMGVLSTNGALIWGAYLAVRAVSVGDLAGLLGLMLIGAIFLAEGAVAMELRELL
jgi:hypothetical protein